VSALLGAFIAALVGALIAAGASFGLVSSQTAVPAPIDKEYVVYGTQ
jgi:ABC-type xylose transport system permease subunit